MTGIDLERFLLEPAERWMDTAWITRAGYAIDDQTAIMVVDGTVKVVLEGHWRLFSR